MLPGIYEAWFRELCGRPSPVETRTHCEECNMLPGAPDLPPEGPFDPAVRCCSYHPRLPPHLVGSLLLQGNKMIEERVGGRLGVTPLGLGPTPEYTALFEKVGSQPGAFGRRREILCPFHDDGRCGIWSHRAMACAAFHCKFDRGPLGHGVWKLLVVGFHAVDHALVKRLLEHAGLDAAACDALLRGGDEARAWGSFFGREREYFVEAARLAAETPLSSLAELAQLGPALRGVMARLDERPPLLRKNPETLYQLGRVRHSGVPFDSLAVPPEVMEAEPDQLDEATIRQLLDWQVLIG